VVALIGVIGTVTPILVSTFSSQSSDEPSVDIGITGYPAPLDRLIELTLTNDGFAPATNLTLIVDASGEIANSSGYVLNTVQVSPIKIDDGRLEAHIPKL